MPLEAQLQLNPVMRLKRQLGRGLKPGLALPLALRRGLVPSPGLALPPALGPGPGSTLQPDSRLKLELGMTRGPRGRVAEAIQH